MKIVETSVIS